MEEALKALIQRVESAPIPESDKIHLYVEIRYALQAAVTPVILRFLPKEEVHTLIKNLSSVSVEQYIPFIVNALNKEGVLEEIERSMQEVLHEIDTAITESGV
jgi:hypothetical protein